MYTNIHWVDWVCGDGLCQPRQPWTRDTKRPSFRRTKIIVCQPTLDTQGSLNSAEMARNISEFATCKLSSVWDTDRTSNWSLLGATNGLSLKSLRVMKKKGGHRKQFTEVRPYQCQSGSTWDKNFTKCGYYNPSRVCIFLSIQTELLWSSQYEKAVMLCSPGWPWISQLPASASQVVDLDLYFPPFLICSSFYLKILKFYFMRERFAWIYVLTPCFCLAP